jgi:paraquat-inducible protein B
MAESPNDPPEARLRRLRFAWIWLVPIVAAAIVLWLGWRTLAEQGPVITISFKSAMGLTPGQTKLRYRDVDIGTVRSLALSKDISKAIVTARVDRRFASHLTSGAQFWIVRPRIGLAGVSGLTTLISGAYIAVEPGPGRPAKTFTGREEPPVLEPNSAGSRFTLHARKLRSLSVNASVYYRGISVGRVLGYRMDSRADGVDIFIYVNAPYDRFVRDSSRFWNASGFGVTLSSESIRASVPAPEALLAGGIEFETPEASLSQPASKPGRDFTLYDDENGARSAPLGPVVTYGVNFAGSVQGLAAHSPVLLDGVQVGEVRSIAMELDRGSGMHRAHVVIEIDPARLGGGPGHGAGDATLLDAAVARGLRATLVTENLLSGQKAVSLEDFPNAPPATIAHEGPYAEIPSVPAGDLDQLARATTEAVQKINRLPLAEIAQGLREIVANVESATNGPELGRAVRNLDRLMSQLCPTLASLRKTLDAARASLQSLDGTLGGGALRNGSDLPTAMRELTNAARSIKELADYLDRHPEALLRGRRASP